MMLLVCSRFVRRREDHREHGFRGAPGLSRHPLLHFGWGQHPSGAEQKPGLQPRGPRREHPAYCWGGAAVCWRRAGVHRQLHFSLQQGELLLRREYTVDKDDNVAECIFPVGQILCMSHFFDRVPFFFLITRIAWMPGRSTRLLGCLSLRCLWTHPWTCVSRGTWRGCTREPELERLEVEYSFIVKRMKKKMDKLDVTGVTRDKRDVRHLSTTLCCPQFSMHLMNSGVFSFFAVEFSLSSLWVDGSLATTHILPETVSRVQMQDFNVALQSNESVVWAVSLYNVSPYPSQSTGLSPYLWQFGFGSLNKIS